MLGIFQKTLEDVVKTAKLQSKDLTTYISICLQEIREELKSKDADVRHKALMKIFFVSNLPVHHLMSILSS